MDGNLSTYFISGTSLVLTVIRSIGNNHGHLGTWCWAQSSRTGKVGNFESFPSSMIVFLVIITGYWDASVLFRMRLQLKFVLHWKPKIIRSFPNGNLWSFFPFYLLVSFRNAVLNLKWNMLIRNKIFISICNWLPCRFQPVCKCCC